MTTQEDLREIFLACEGMPSSNNFLTLYTFIEERNSQELTDVFAKLGKNTDVRYVE